jgi:anti-anti-sigma regulatory factor
MQVDGVLDAVPAYDLRGLLTSLLATGHHHVQFDLSQVTYADAGGVAGLAWCADHAMRTDNILTWRGCSRPVLAALHSHPYAGRVERPAS